MKKLNILKTLIDLFYFFSIIAVAGFSIVAVMFAFGDDSIPLKINGSEIEVSDWQSKLLLFFAIASAVCFTYAIYLLRKVIAQFVRRDIFNDQVVLNFNKIGISLIVSATLMQIPLFIYNAMRREKTGFEFSTGGFDSFILAICLGLFFMVLSEIFRIAKNIKEENELTV